MPTYEYVCASCSNQWEEIQKISDPPIKTCPKCSKKKAKRQISGGSFILKGGGWYADLYSSAKPAKKDDGGSTKESCGSKDTSSGDAKPKESTASTAPAKTESTTPKAASGGDKS
jgi:putative FmdB family regulatory protein